METQQLPTPMTTIKFLRLFALRHRSRATISALLAYSLFLWAPMASADVNSVLSSPNSVSAPVRDSYSFSVMWQITRTETVATGTRLVRSSSASLIVNGKSLGSVGGAISSPSTLVRGLSGSVSISDTITLNSSQLKAIASNPAGRAQIVRSFTDTQTSQSSNLAIYAASSGAGELDVNRIDLSFTSNARTDVVNKGSSLHAVADINFSSSGILRGEWRLIDPTTSYGSQTGRVLQVIRQPLVSSGQGRTRITSPQLPTKQSGLYLLAFYVEQDDNPIDIPILRYFVIDNGEEQPLNIKPLTSFSPEENAMLDTETVFSWAEVVNADAYQVEIFERRESRPLTGKLVPAPVLQLKLSSMSLDWLQPGKQYLWRVKALAANGQTLAISSKQAIQTP